MAMGQKTFVIYPIVSSNEAAKLVPCWILASIFVLPTQLGLEVFGKAKRIYGGGI
jgi:hypothetical protein